MKIQCIEEEYCKVKVHYIAEENKVIQKRKETLKSLRSAKISGFRPGKAPDHIIEFKLKKQIDELVKKELVAEAYDDILFETKMKPIGYPQVQHSGLHGSEFWCDLIVLKKPSFDLKQYKDFEIPSPAMPISAGDMAQKMLQELRQRHGDFAPYGENDFVQVNDKVTMDLNCFDGETKVDKLCQQGILYTVGQNMYPDFDDNIVGMSAGEARNFVIKFGAEYPEDLRDKTLNFEVKIHMGLRNNAAPLDDSLAEKIGFDKFDTLLKEVENVANSRTEHTRNQLIDQQITKRLLSENPFDAPEWCIKLEAQQLAGVRTEAEFKALSEDKRGSVWAQAINNVRLAFILDSISEAEPEASFSDLEVIDVIKNKVAQTGQDADRFVVESSRDGRLMGLMARVRNEAVLAWIRSKCKIIE